MFRFPLTLVMKEQKLPSLEIRRKDRHLTWEQIWLLKHQNGHEDYRRSNHLGWVAKKQHERNHKEVGNIFMWKTASFDPAWSLPETIAQCHWLTRSALLPKESLLRQTQNSIPIQMTWLTEWIRSPQFKRCPTWCLTLCQFFSFTCFGSFD